MRNAGLEEAQARIKIARRHINNLRYADDTTLMEKSEPIPKKSNDKECSNYRTTALISHSSKVMIVPRM